MDDADIDTDEGESMLENLFGFGVDRTPTEQQARGRARYEYANQPSLDQVGAAFAFYDRTPAPSSSGNGLSAFQSRSGGLRYDYTGAGSTVRYLTDSRFGTFAEGGAFRDSVGGHPELASSGGEALVRIWTDDINFSNRDILRFSPYASRGGRTLFYTTNRDGTFQLQTSEAIRSARMARFDPVTFTFNRNPERTPPEFQSVIQVRVAPGSAANALGVQTRTTDSAVLEEANAVVTYDARNQWRQASGIRDDVGYIIGRRSAVDRLVDLGAAGLIEQLDSSGRSLLIDGRGNIVEADFLGNPVTVTGIDGNPVPVETDDFDNPLVDKNGDALGVDGDGNAVRADAAGKTFKLDSNGNVERADGAGKTFKSDRNGNLERRKDGDGNVLRVNAAGDIFKLDDNGNVLRVDAAGKPFKLNRNGNIVRVRVDDDGNVKLRGKHPAYRYADGTVERISSVTDNYEYEDGTRVLASDVTPDYSYVYADGSNDIVPSSSSPVYFVYADNMRVKVKDATVNFVYADGSVVPRERLDYDFAYGNIVGYTYDGLSVQTITHAYNNPWGATPMSFRGNVGILLVPKDSLGNPLVDELGRALRKDSNGFAVRADEDGRVFRVDNNGDLVRVDDAGNVDQNGENFRYDDENADHVVPIRDAVTGKNLPVYFVYANDDDTIVTIVPSHLLDFTVGEDATASDVGLLALIRGLVNPEDANNLATLDVATHGIAPGAELDVYTTHGLRETSLCASIAHPSDVAEDATVGDCGTTGYGDVKAVRGGVNLYDAILRAGAGVGVSRGNVLLLDNRLAASGLSMVLATRDFTEAPFSDNNLWHIESQRDGGFSTDLESYFVRLNNGAVALRTAMTDGNAVKVYEQDGYKAKGNEVTTFDDTTLTQAQIVWSVIDGHYGDGTMLRSRNDLGANAHRALNLLLRMRHNLQWNGDSVIEDYDALIFAADDAAGARGDVGLFAGLPIYIDMTVQAYRDVSEAGFRAALRGGKAPEVVGGGELISILNRAVTGGGSDYTYVSGRKILYMRSGANSWVFNGVPRALADGLDSAAVFEFVDGRNEVHVTLGDGRVFALDVPVGLETPLPYYLSVVAAETGETRCGIVAQDYCIAAPGAYNYRNPGADGVYDEDDKLVPVESTARGAAALVAGGFALLQEVFDGQLNTAELIARIKQTASQNFDLDDDKRNDYTQHGGAKRYGHGLFDLECATRTSTTRERCRPPTSTPANSRGRCADPSQLLRGDECVSETVCLSVDGRVIDVDRGMCLTDVSQCANGERNIANRRCTSHITATVCANRGQFLAPGPRYQDDAENFTPSCVRTCPKGAGVAAGNVCVLGCKEGDGVTPGTGIKFENPTCIKSSRADNTVLINENTCGDLGRFVSVDGLSCLDACPAGAFAGVAHNGKRATSCIASTCSGLTPLYNGATGRRIVIGESDCVTEAQCKGHMVNGFHSVVSADGKQCLRSFDNCPVGQGVSSDDECTESVTDASCGGASRFVSSDGESCVAGCGAGEFLGGSGISGIGSATCYTADSCRGAGGGRALLDGGTCVAATAESCYNLGSATYLYDGTDSCVDECASGEFRRMVDMDNRCVDADACLALNLAPVTKGAVLGMCVEATARLCAQADGRGFDDTNGACDTASASTCDTSSGISFANGKCTFCGTGQGFSGGDDGACVDISSLAVAERISACGRLSRLYDSASPDACVNNGAGCAAGKVQGRSEVMVNGTGSQAQCITVAQCAGGMFGVSDSVCVDAAAGSCYGAGAYYFDTTNGCVSDCGASNAHRTVGMLNTCVSQMDCRGAMINGAVVRGECLASSGVNCDADGGRVYATTKCIENSRACIIDEGGLGYNPMTNSCTTATAGACTAADAEFFFGGGNCVAMCGMGEGATDDRTCTTMASNDNCRNAGRAFDVAAGVSGECKTGNACADDGTEFLGGDGFGTNSCYTVGSCIGAKGGRAMDTGECVAASPQSCRTADTATTYYHDTDRGCVESCSMMSMGDRTITRALSGGNSCVTESDCRGMPHTGVSRGAVRSGGGVCVAANPSTCAEDNGRGYRNGVCVVDATGQACDRNFGIQFVSGTGCVACDEGEGFLNNACTMGATSISRLPLADRITACEGSMRLYNHATTACVATAKQCTNNTIQGRSTFDVNGVPSDTQCITVEQCAGGMSGLDVGTNRCVAASAMTCGAVTSATHNFDTTHYHDMTGGCVSSCSTSNMGGRTVNRSLSNGNECVTPANCRDTAFAGRVNGAVVGGACAVASGMNCNSDGTRAFNSAGTGCVESCIDDGGRGRDSAHNCVAAAADTCRIAGGDVDDMGFYDGDASRCVQTASDCSGGQFGEMTSMSENSCVAVCSANLGATDARLCTATANAGTCGNAARVFLTGGGCAQACLGTTTPTFVRGTNTCVTDMACGAMRQGVEKTTIRLHGRPVAQKGCIASPTASQCFNAGSAYFRQGSFCVTTCADATPLKRSIASENSCVNEVTCRTAGEAVVGRVCLAANPVNCFAYGGRGFNVGTTRCDVPSSSTCDENFNYIFDDVDMCVLGSFVDIEVTGIDTKEKALDLFTGTPGTATKAEQIATEYQNQPSLAQVGVAQAYVSQGADNGIDNLSQLNIGNGSEISVITNKRFDPNHPEFWSSDSDTPFRTLSKFIAWDDGAGTLFTDGPQTLLAQFFDNDDDERVEVYQQGSNAGAVIATMSVGKIAGADFESITGVQFTQTNTPEAMAERTAFETFMRTIVGGSDFIVNMGSLNFVGATYDLDASGNYNISLRFSHVGRVYEEGGNLASYQFVFDPTENSQNFDGTYVAGVPAVATDAEMGILALINGMLHADGTGGDANTHGVAPGAILSVFASPKAGTDGHNALDLIYRARSIDVGRDRDPATGDLIVDKDRNIVVIQNTIVSTPAAAHLAGETQVRLISTLPVFKHKVMFEALNFGVKAPDDATAAEKAAQDIYVFAAIDDSTEAKGVGAFAAISRAATSKFAAYSVAVVAAESTANVFCGEFASSFCLAAPGAYKYRVRTGNAYTETEPGNGAATSNAAASLVAGGFALLEDRFGSQMGSDELVARMLALTSQCFSLDADDPAWDGSSCTNSKNKYVNEKGTPTVGDLQTKRYGQGLLDLECATRPLTQRTHCRRVSSATPASCLSAMDGFDGLNCVTTGSTAADCGRAGGILSGGDCIARSACGTFINVGDDECVAMCGTGEGATSTGMCTATANDGNCKTAMRRFDVANSDCHDMDMCATDGTEFLGGGGTFGTNSCYTLDRCVADNGGLSSVGGGNCVGASAMTCYNAGASTYFLDGITCRTSCSLSPLMRSRSGSNDCVSNATCRSDGRGAVQGGNCVVPSEIDCAQDDGSGFMNNICVVAMPDTCTGDATYDTNTGRCVVAAVGANAIIAAFRGTVNTGEASALASTSGITNSSDVEDKRRLEYANQPSLDIVGAAFAYGKVGEKEADIAAAITAIEKAGADSHISVITNKRFDPFHPEFSSATATSFKTLTRFYFRGVASTFSGITNVVPTIFKDDSGKIVQVYDSGYDADEVYFSVPVPQIDGEDYEDIVRKDSDDKDSADNANRRNQIAEFLATLVGGTPVSSGGFIASPKAMTLTDAGSYWRYELDAGGSYYIPINLTSDKGIHHAGRVYDSGNLRSYQVVIQSAHWVRGHAQGGECNTNNNCYDGNTPEAATGAEMGIFALINGLMNPDAPGVAYNTHGIAPGATLDVITTNKLDIPRANGRDSALRARSIDIGRDSGADGERNIVIIQNGIFSSNQANDITLSGVNSSVGSGADYEGLYEALQVGLADSITQDAYVFAARDGNNKNDVGILAALPISTEGTSILDYSIIVVAVEDGQTPCGSNAKVRDICIAAPGEYKFRARPSSGVYATSLTTSTTQTSANAAASLVAGGLALLQSIFPTEKTTRLIDRLLMTASHEVQPR